MRDPERIDEVLRDLAIVWRKDPDLRLGQLMMLLVRPEAPSPEMFNIEDSQLHKRIRRAIRGRPLGLPESS
ncbi:MAG: hypothetical protein AAGM22_17990 [Acidobacteriota bacterium]